MHFIKFHFVNKILLFFLVWWLICHKYKLFKGVWVFKNISRPTVVFQTAEGPQPYITVWFYGISQEVVSRIVQSCSGVFRIFAFPRALESGIDEKLRANLLGFDAKLEMPCLPSWIYYFSRPLLGSFSEPIQLTHLQITIWLYAVWYAVKGFTNMHSWSEEWCHVARIRQEEQDL